MPLSAAVSVVIPNWNRSALLVAVLASIRVQTLQPLEIIVVDNGSTDRSSDVARAAGAQVLQLDVNKGFSFAVNRGLEAARGDFIAIVNNDVEFEPDWIENLASSLSQGNAWFAIGKLLDYSHREQIDGVGDAICRGGAACRLGHGHPDDSLFYTPRFTYFPSGTAVLMRREFFQKTGKLDESFFSYLEDVDLGIRAGLLDLPGIYVPEAIAYHRGSATLGAWSSPVVESLTRNQILLLAKYYPLKILWRFFRPILVAQILWAAMAARHGRLSAYLAGLVSGLRSIASSRRCNSKWRRDGNRLAAVLLHSEQELLKVQRATGWDRFWWWYLRLAPSARESST
jgi:GT2 family glycosyltransferase